MTKSTKKPSKHNPLLSHITRVQMALSGINNPIPPDVSTIHELQEWAERAKKGWEKKCRITVQAYNEARIQYFCNAVVHVNMAWCSYGKHLVPANQLRLVRETGAYLDSDCNYSKYLRSFKNVYTACLDHAITLKTTQKGVSGEYRSYDIDPIVCKEWQAYFDCYQLTDPLVEQYSIPPEMKIIEGERLRIKLGKTELSADIKLPETRP